MMNPVTTETLAEPAPTHWVSRAAFPVLVIVFFFNQLALGAAVYLGWGWLEIILMLTVSHIMHGISIGFHEASHGLLRKSRQKNELDGTIIGIFSFTSFSLYRAAHQLHHAYLATERDEELWPFVIPGTPRLFRILAALLELTVGLFYTPSLFIRTFLRSGSPIRNKKLRRRIWAEFGLTALVWIALLAIVASFNLWKYFVWMYLAPAVLAANMQSLRKYIEHVGLSGSTVNGATRSIVSKGPLGRFVAFTLLHEPYHGVHHRHAGVPHAELPQHVAVLQPKTPDELPPFAGYRHAFMHLLRNLADPRAGAQWQTVNLR